MLAICYKADQRSESLKAIFECRLPSVVTPKVPAWKLEDGPEGPDELDLELEDLVAAGREAHAFW